MNPVDTFCGAFIAYHAVVGLARGFVFQLVRLLTWVVGIVLSRLYSNQLAERLTAAHPDIDPGSARVLSWVLIVGGVFVIGAIVVAFFKKLLARLQLSGLDRLAGLVFGAAKAALIVLIVAIGVLVIAQRFEFEERLSSCRTFNWSAAILERSSFALPDELSADLETRIEAFQSRVAAGVAADALSAPGFPAK